MWYKIQWKILQNLNLKIPNLKPIFLSEFSVFFLFSGNGNTQTRPLGPGRLQENTLITNYLFHTFISWYLDIMISWEYCFFCIGSSYVSLIYRIMLILSETVGFFYDLWQSLCGEIVKKKQLTPLKKKFFLKSDNVLPSRMPFRK